MTIKAVRHYHRRGLLEEPPRDASGYRRYSAEHAIDLVKIKTLAEAGVPLARIKELLAADPDRFTAAIAEIDRNLQERAEELLRARERLAQLRAGDRLFVSAEVADYLDRLHALGVSQRAMQMERDGWILMQSVSPKEAAIWLADKRDAHRRSGVLRHLPRARRRLRLVAGRPAPLCASRSRATVARQLAREPHGGAKPVRTWPSLGWSRRRSACRRRPGTGSSRSPSRSKRAAEWRAPPA